MNKKYITAKEWYERFGDCPVLWDTWGADELKLTRVFLESNNYYRVVVTFAKSGDPVIGEELVMSNMTIIPETAILDWFEEPSSTTPGASLTSSAAASIHVSVDGYYCETCGAAPGELHLSKCLEKIPTEMADLRSYCSACGKSAERQGQLTIRHNLWCSKLSFNMKKCICDFQSVIMRAGCQCGGA